MENLSYFWVFLSCFSLFVWITLSSAIHRCSLLLRPPAGKDEMTIYWDLKNEEMFYDNCRSQVQTDLDLEINRSTWDPKKVFVPILIKVSGIVNDALLLSSSDPAPVGQMGPSWSEEAVLYVQGALLLLSLGTNQAWHFSSPQAWPHHGARMEVSRAPCLNLWAQMCLAHQAGQRKRYSSLHQRKSPGGWNLSLLPLFQTRHSIKPRWYPSDILTWWYFNPVIVWPSSDRGWARKDLFQCRDCSLS